MLQAYVFPGNMRELRKLLQRAVLTCRDGVMRAADLHLPTVAVPPLPGEQPLADVERAPIRALLDAHAGHRNHVGGRARHCRAHALSQAQALRPELIRKGRFTCRAP